MYLKKTHYCYLEQFKTQKDTFNMGNVLLYVNYTLVRLIFKFKNHFLRKKIMTLQKSSYVLERSYLACPGP